MDPYRAGRLCMEPQAVAETVILQWIIRTKEFVIAGDFLPYPGLLQFIEHCGPSSKILNELATLDLSKICDQISDDQEHKEFHQIRLCGKSLFHVVNWLQTFPEPPQEVIHFWDTQMAAIRHCERILGQK
ncbi:hypothetical protein MVEN_02311000 [Mycena venus]|uniref:Uncharacterized protein n=1 Tax=Mycena venus TaxID=2733690 RepID=A0A8H6X4V2_9AGAR|nr:hypothetical protein MVEN_02311000 [Mycena venus]